CPRRSPRGAAHHAGAPPGPDARRAAAQPALALRRAGRPVTRFRLLETGPRDGAANMALDEALMCRRIKKAGPPTVRLYGWAPATLSLGYGQALDGSIDLDAVSRMGIGLVRRPTGGSAILHEGPELELTYSVVGAETDFAGADDLLETYRWIGSALAAGLRTMGVPAEMVPVKPASPHAMPAFCFARTGSYELQGGGRILVVAPRRP